MTYPSGDDEPGGTRGESVVLAIRTTRTQQIMLDGVRGHLTRSCFAARALQFALDCLERNEPRALEQFAAPPVNDHFRGKQRVENTTPNNPPSQPKGRPTLVHINAEAPRKTAARECE